MPPSMETLEIREENIGAYLAGRNWPPGGGSLWVTSLGGGVSNIVLLVESDSARVVVKQSLEKLRVQDDWRARRDRILRERDCIRTLRGILPSSCLPEIVLEDDVNFLFAMTAAPPGVRAWKTDLLEGRVETAIAARAGDLLGRMHFYSCGDPKIRAQYADQTCFDQLRIDPYYRACMRHHPDVAGRIGTLIEQMGRRRLALVHGDYSPKNMLVIRPTREEADTAAEIFLIDFEVAHYGDPAFDTGFLLNHLLLKSFYRPLWRIRYLEAACTFWRTYRAAIPPVIGKVVEEATCRHLGALLLARVDGKSPVEYLDEEARNQVRSAARRVLLTQPCRLEEVFELCWPSAA